MTDQQQPTAETDETRDQLAKNLFDMSNAVFAGRFELDVKPLLDALSEQVGKLTEAMTYLAERAEAGRQTE